MKLASCDNCAHRAASNCALGMTPPEGEFLCHRYAMTTTFRDEARAAAAASTLPLEFGRDEISDAERATTTYLGLLDAMMNRLRVSPQRRQPR